MINIIYNHKKIVNGLFNYHCVCLFVDHPQSMNQQQRIKMFLTAIISNYNARMPLTNVGL